MIVVHGRGGPHDVQQKHTTSYYYCIVSDRTTGTSSSTMNCLLRLVPPLFGPKQARARAPNYCGFRIVDPLRTYHIVITAVLCMQHQSSSLLSGTWSIMCHSHQIFGLGWVALLSPGQKLPKKCGERIGRVVHSIPPFITPRVSPAAG